MRGRQANYHQQEHWGDSPLDNHAATEDEAQWLTAVVTGIEFLAVGLQGTTVMHLDLVAIDSAAVTLDGLDGLYDEAIGGGGGVGGSRHGDCSSQDGQDGCKAHV